MPDNLDRENDLKQDNTTEKLDDKKDNIKPETPSISETVVHSSRETVVEEVGGPSGPEPTRYGDWEVGGRCSDF